MTTVIPDTGNSVAHHPPPNVHDNAGLRSTPPTADASADATAGQSGEDDLIDSSYAAAAASAAPISTPETAISTPPSTAPCSPDSPSPSPSLDYAELGSDYSSPAFVLYSYTSNQHFRITENVSAPQTGRMGSVPCNNAGSFTPGASLAETLSLDLKEVRILYMDNDPAQALVAKRYKRMARDPEVGDGVSVPVGKDLLIRGCRTAAKVKRLIDKFENRYAARVGPHPLHPERSPRLRASTPELMAVLDQGVEVAWYLVEKKGAHFFDNPGADAARVTERNDVFEQKLAALQHYVLRESVRRFGVGGAMVLDGFQGYLVPCEEIGTYLDVFVLTDTILHTVNGLSGLQDAAHIGLLNFASAHSSYCPPDCKKVNPRPLPDISSLDVHYLGHPAFNAMYSYRDCDPRAYWVHECQARRVAGYTGQAILSKYTRAALGM